MLDKDGFSPQQGVSREDDQAVGVSHLTAFAADFRLRPVVGSLVVGWARAGPKAEKVGAPKDGI
jgi:hypothetical protein